jgi:hypothetical protein
MLAIGFGKHRGASHLHSFSIDRFGELLPAAGSLILERMCVPFGIAIVEDSYEDAAIVEAVPGERFGSREPELLRLAREYLPRLPMDDVDVLLIQQIGKNISGTGMDPNVTGRFSNPSMASHVRIGRAVVLDLSPETHGNASGLGLADVATIRAAGKVDFHRTYTNLLTSQMLEGAKLPVIAPSDREAVLIAATTLWGVEPAEVRLAWIKNTLELGELRVSDPLWRELAGRPGLEPLSDPEPMRFDEAGTLLLD